MCWQIIKEDFYKLCKVFFNLEVNLESINNSFITLVAKINNPESVNDYRPISLLNMDIKLLTKLLADRLQLVILKLLHANQYGFIRSRTSKISLLGVLNLSISATIQRKK